jgi:hypothetical protein
VPSCSKFHLTRLHTLRQSRTIIHPKSLHLWLVCVRRSLAVANARNRNNCKNEPLLSRSLRRIRIDANLLVVMVVFPPIKCWKGSMGKLSGGDLVLTAGLDSQPLLGNSILSCKWPAFFFSTAACCCSFPDFECSTIHLLCYLLATFPSLRLQASELLNSRRFRTVF